MRIVLSILFIFFASNVRAPFIPSSVHESVYPSTAYPDISITIWSTTGCGVQKVGDRVDLSSGEPSSPSNILPTGENYATFTWTRSYWLSRDLINTERLDWSKCANDTDSAGDLEAECLPVGNIKADCTEFLLRTSPDSNSNALLANTCYLLDPAAQVSHILSLKWSMSCDTY